MSATEMSRVTNTSAKPPRMTQSDGFIRKIGLDLGPQRGGLKEERDSWGPWQSKPKGTNRKRDSPGRRDEEDTLGKARLIVLMISTRADSSQKRKI